jgi:hypothetical protein
MTPEIVDKLNKFLTNHVPFKEECEAVYLMVELRKLIDREVKDQYRLVRFYCDWTVHPIKNHNNRFISEVKSIIDEVFEASSIDFLMPTFRTEMLSLFTTYDLLGELCTDKAAWKHFVNVFVQVLADQPIVEPKLGLSSFRYESGSQDHIVVEITFNDHRETQRFESGVIF